MKTFILKFSVAFLLLALMGTGCEKEEEPGLKGPAEGYIVGSFICDKIDPKTGVATGNRTERGYCILLEESANEDAHWPMDFYTFDLPSEFFDFPDDVLNQTSSFNDCGPSFFPENLKSNYRVRFQYRKSSEKQKIKFSCGPCTALFPSFPWNYYSQVSLKNISRVN